MLLSLKETAKRLGKSPRQVRYMIQEEKLAAKKIGNRWVIDSDDLPFSDGQKEALDRRERQLRSAVEDGLGLDESKRRYSIRDLKAFQVALPIYQKGSERLTDDHPATQALRQVLEHLSRGCHRFERSAKIEAYREARDAASLAVCEMLILGDGTDDLVTAIEQDLMAALAGLLRRLEGRGKR